MQQNSIPIIAGQLGHGAVPCLPNERLSSNATILETQSRHFRVYCNAVTRLAEGPSAGMACAHSVAFRRGETADLEIDVVSLGTDFAYPILIGSGTDRYWIARSGQLELEHVSRLLRDAIFVLRFVGAGDFWGCEGTHFIRRKLLTDFEWDDLPFDLDELPRWKLG